MNTPMKQLNARLVAGKKVVMRFDGNVPMVDGTVLPEGLFRLRAIVATVTFLRSAGAEVLLLTHLGRPSGIEKKYSTHILIPILKRLFGVKVLFSEDFKRTDFVAGRVTLFENVRFYSGEQKNEQMFARMLANLGDVYVDDGFAVAHRADASVVGIPKLLPHAAGFCMTQEVRALSKARDEYKAPLVLVVGGVKMETKVPLVTAFRKKGATILLGAAIAHELCATRPKHEYPEGFIFPVDGRVIRRGKVAVVTFDEALTKNETMFDIGPKTEKLFALFVSKAKTVIWNGPLGKNEDTRFARGTRSMITACKKTRAATYAGGGETVSAIVKSRAVNAFTHVSTGGGAMLAFLAGEHVPGVDVLT